MKPGCPAVETAATVAKSTGVDFCQSAQADSALVAATSVARR